MMTMTMMVVMMLLMTNMLNKMITLLHSWREHIQGGQRWWIFWWIWWRWRWWWWWRICIYTSYMMNKMITLLHSWREHIQGGQRWRISWWIWWQWRGWWWWCWWWRIRWCWSPCCIVDESIFKEGGEHKEHTNSRPNVHRLNSKALSNINQISAHKMAKDFLVNSIKRWTEFNFQSLNK